MKLGRVVFGVALAALFSVALFACSGAPAPSAPKQVDESYSGKQVEIAAGDTLAVILVSNPSTGFKWELAMPTDNSVVKMVDNKYEAAATSLAGASGKEVWTFKAAGKGTSAIRMEYSRPWAGGEKAVKVFELNVVVK